MQDVVVWANSFLPNEIEREDRLQRTYFAEQGSPMLVDYVQREEDTYSAHHRLNGCPA
ncbi:hypothetical protein GCM10011445_16910 [Pseudocitrobacter faecalis]|nr:hypothetical protein GCM10011445_16910 [Pseudocitrobacter faecalis]